MGLNLNLSPELMLHTFFLHLRLEQHLQCNNCLEFLHSRKIDISKFSLSKWPTNVKVINGNFPEIKTNKSSFKYSGQRQHIRNIELALGSTLTLKLSWRTSQCILSQDLKITPQLKLSN